MLKNLRRKAPEKDKLGHDLFKLGKVRGETKKIV